VPDLSSVVHHWLVSDLFFLQTRRLLRIHQEMTSMHLSSTSRTFLVLQLHFSSILYMTHTVRVLISFVGTPSAFVRVSQLLFLMGFGSTFQTMMPLPSLSSPLRGILGKDDAFQQLSSFWQSPYANLVFMS
jgi:hypothetical protein